jgi:dihydrofolate reductase
MKLTGIVAMTPDRIIGRDGTLPWHLPADLAFFKKTTTGYPIVMGRATYDSIGRPLPKRRNIVVTRNPHWSAEGVEVIASPDELSSLGLDGEVFIIGGAAIYEAFLPLLDELLVSHVSEPHRGDTRFPAFEHLFEPPGIVEKHDEFEVRRYLRLKPGA